jgi:hypothetical protein
MHRELEQSDGTYALRERSEAYRGDFSGESDSLVAENAIPWDENAEIAARYAVRPEKQIWPKHQNPCSETSTFVEDFID